MSSYLDVQHAEYAARTKYPEVHRCSAYSNILKRANLQPGQSLLYTAWGYKYYTVVNTPTVSQDDIHSFIYKCIEDVRGPACSEDRWMEFIDIACSRAYGDKEWVEWTINGRFDHQSITLGVELKFIDKL